MEDRLDEVIAAKLENEIDTVGGLASLLEIEGTISLETYLELRGNASRDNK